MAVAIVAVPSVTQLPPEADGAVVVGGSHAALYAAHLVAFLFDPLSQSE